MFGWLTQLAARRRLTLAALLVLVAVSALISWAASWRERARVRLTTEWLERRWDKDAGQLETDVVTMGAVAVPHLVRLLERGTTSEKTAIAQMLARFGRDASPAIPALVAVLCSPNQEQELRHVTARAVADTGAAGVQVLIDLLRHPDPRVRETAVNVLGSLGPDALRARDSLRDLLVEGNQAVEAAAAQALWQIDRDASRLVPVLVRLVQNAAAGPCRRAADTLCAMGPRAAGAERVLLCCLKSPEPHRRTAAASALGSIRAASPEVIESLGLLLTDTDPYARLEATRAIVVLRGLTDRAAAVLCDLLADKERPLQLSVLLVVEGMGTEARPLVPAVIRSLQHPDENVRSRSAWVLSEIGHGFPEVVSALTRTAQSDQIHHVRQTALESLRRLGTRQDGDSKDPR